MKRVAIVIPAHNEEDRIGRTLKEYIEYFGKLDMDYRIVVVLNACSDNSLSVVSEFDVDVLNFLEGGKGFAITQGFKEALRGDFDLIGFIDADMATPPNAFYDLVKNIDGYGGIIGNRWNKKSKVIKQTFFRQILSRGFNFLVKALFLFQYEDTQCGAKLFSREALERIMPDLYVTHWAYDINLLYAMKKRGLKVVEIPTEWIDRAGSKVNVKKVPLMMFIGIVRLRIINSPFNFVSRFYDKLPEWTKVYRRWW